MSFERLLPRSGKKEVRNLSVARRQIKLARFFGVLLTNSPGPSAEQCPGIAHLQECLKICPHHQESQFPEGHPRLPT